jgi:hypothetical protein
MSGYVWDLSGTDNRCQSYALGHLIHWIHFNHSMWEPSAVVPVTAEVDDDGLVHIEGDDVSLVRWNHRAALLRDALHRFGGRAVWKPRWYILAVPEEAFFGGARSVFSLAVPDERRDCYVIRRADSGAPPPRADTAARQRYVERIWAEQEATNAKLHTIDYSHIPPLRIADRYAAGTRRKGPSARRHRK